MKWISVAFMGVLCAALVVMMACSAAQIEKTAEVVQEGAKAAQSILPPPFGVIAAGVAGLAGVIASLAAAKAKGTAVAANADPHPVADFLSSHSWIYPSIAAVVGVANSLGWIHVSATELGTLASALGVATVTQVASDAHAENQAPAGAAPKPS